MITHDEASALLGNYIKAKDENRPYLLKDVFFDDAAVDMAVETATISFPPRLQGLDAIVEALVRNFGRTYENVHTYYLGKPTDYLSDGVFICDWVVAMTEKATGSVRVGCGGYRWEFDRAPANRWLVRRLAIKIVAMQALPVTDWPVVAEWIGRLAYPWTDHQSVLLSLPPLSGLSDVRTYLGALGQKP